MSVLIGKSKFSVSNPQKCDELFGFDMLFSLFLLFGFAIQINKKSQR